jgi:hypothetical protein
MLVRLPGREDYLTMPAPIWLLWAGVARGAAAFAVFALARQTSPVYESDPGTPSRRPRRERRIRLRDVGRLLTLSGALVTY